MRLLWPAVYITQPYKGNRTTHRKIATKKRMTDLLRQTALFVVTALAEIIGCYLPWLVLKQGRTGWILVPAAMSLALFSWLLTLHPTAAGRTYAAYGGIYIAVALFWLRYVDDAVLTRWDVAGACVALLGMTIIVIQPHT
jgi:small multidrug resistance family-3 protein